MAKRGRSKRFTPKWTADDCADVWTGRTERFIRGSEDDEPMRRKASKKRKAAAEKPRIVQSPKRRVAIRKEK